MNKHKVMIEIDVPNGQEFVGFMYCLGAFIPQFKEVIQAKKVIDLSCIAGSGIDCEFSQDGKNWNVIGGLRQIRPDPYNQSGATLYDATNKRSRLACRIRQSPHVHFWNRGDKCPLPDGLKVILFFHEHGLHVRHIITGQDPVKWQYVIAFEVLGVAEGRRHEWEEECKE